MNKKTLVVLSETAFMAAFLVAQVSHAIPKEPSVVEQTAMLIVPDNSLELNSTLLEVLQKNPNLSMFVQALSAASLLDEMEHGGPYTVFAPTNDAFNKLPEGMLQDIFKSNNKEKLIQLLQNHIVLARLVSSEVPSIKLKAMSGKELDVVIKGKQITVNDANVVQADVLGKNGVIDVIDKVII